MGKLSLTSMFSLFLIMSVVLMMRIEVDGQKTEVCEDSWLRLKSCGGVICYKECVKKWPTFISARCTFLNCVCAYAC
ncbi:hypothetical protein AAHE18_19G030400 [Arachis hypogaea]|uniref:Knottin scorpion toxin-like domain-containing protein n=1 Tax=Arachis hypogaea TaxID=3818 RepID=A0A6B9V3F8_ARAHY|nr:uncharacterized protein DS421_19g638320 [Arachis hypogaea]